MAAQPSHLKMLTELVSMRLERERLMRFLSYVDGWCTDRSDPDVEPLRAAVEACKADIVRMGES